MVAKWCRISSVHSRLSTFAKDWRVGHGGKDSGQDKAAVARVPFLDNPKLDLNPGVPLLGISTTPGFKSTLGLSKKGTLATAILCHDMFRTFLEYFRTRKEPGPGTSRFIITPDALHFWQVPTGHHLSAERVMVLWRDADREGEGELDLEASLGLLFRGAATGSRARLESFNPSLCKAEVLPVLHEAPRAGIQQREDLFQRCSCS